MTIDSNIEPRLLRFTTGFAGRLPATEIENAADLISRGEWGVGLEILCAQLAEYEIDLSASEAKELKEIALAMGLDVSDFGLITNPGSGLAK
jgi:hypothetical protein